MAKKKNNKILRYRRRFRPNVGMIIFAIMFIYVGFSVYTYWKKDTIQFYEVAEGDIVNDTRHTGLILREEQVQTTDRAGYINYYVREGKRAAIGSRIFSIDETGSTSEQMEKNQETSDLLTDENLSEIKRQLSSFVMSYSDQSFDELYDLQYTLEASVLEYANFNALGNLDSLIETNNSTFRLYRAPLSGVVSYSIDGYENFDLSQISEQDFLRTDYTKAITKAGQLMEQSAPVYKLITSDNWSIVFPLTEEEISLYQGKNTLHVTFPSNDLETDGKFSILTGSDGKSFGKLDFNQYMVQFVKERFIEFELDAEEVDGLKIPVTAVTEKMFYLIPVEYMVQGGDSSAAGFLKEVYSEKGTSAEFVPVTIYYSTDDYYYVDMSEESPLKAGDYIIRSDSTDRYQIGASESLKGVYNINKGYAVFKQIEILKSNDEYHTVKKGTSYGLSVYDHIVLDAKTVYEGQLIYQ